MSPQDHNHPDLTAYALGELAPADAARVRKWLAQSPAALAELERIQQTLCILNDAPALPKRTLHPRQRETVLAMAQAPVSRPKNVVPFLGFRRPGGESGVNRTSSGIMWPALKFAAAACLAAGAFVLGQKSAGRITPLVAGQGATVSEAPKGGASKPGPAPAVGTKTDVAVASSPMKAVTSPVSTNSAKAEAAVPVTAKLPVAPPPATVAQTKAAAAPVPTPQTAAPAPKPAPAVAVAATKPNAPHAAPAPAPLPTAVSLKGFAQATAASEAVLKVHPASIRPMPVPHEFAGVVLASPLPADAKPDPAARKAEVQPALVIHSWKAEIASCPWDASRRLMRFVAQIPVDQSGIEDSDKEYKLVAKFDPFHVQGYRLVTEKHMRASDGGTQATRFAWYEIIPTRNFNAAADRPLTIGSISIEQPRGGSAQDSTPLKLVDRGLTWGDAREDFVFETAMIGWNLLLNGTDNISGLNSKLVLDLAEKTRGEDAKGERAKFINVVKQAQKAVGM